MTEPNIPVGNDQLQARITKMSIMPPGENIFSELATHFEIGDEANGEFIIVEQHGGHTDYSKKIIIDVNEWDVFKECIDFMISQCRPNCCDARTLLNTPKPPTTSDSAEF